MTPRPDRDGADLPKWVVPCTPGYQQAIQNAGTVVAPFLAGFSAALLALLLDGAIRGEIEWPDAAMLAIVIAAIAFVAAVQTAVAARTHSVTPDEMLSWYTELSTADLEQKQQEYVVNHDRWADWTLRFYRIGLVAFLAGIVLILVPKGEFTVARIVVVSVASAGLVGELAWIGKNWFSRRGDPRYEYRRSTPKPRQQATGG